MYLQTLKLQNFRNYQKLSVCFPDQVIVLVGANATGKTNLLEAIRFLSLFKSWRTSHTPDLIRWGNDFTRVEGLVNDDGQRQNIVSALAKENTKQSPKRIVTINGAKILSRKAVGNFLTVLFSPDDLLLVSANPKDRRRYLDIVLGQIFSRYHEALQRYNQALEQRNALIFESTGLKLLARSQAEIWEAQMAAEGSRLIKERSLFLEFINQELTHDYQGLSHDSSQLKLAYQPALDMPGVELLLADQQLFSLLQSSWRKNWSKDLLVKQTTVGPHRDDFVFLLNNRPLVQSGSRGEWRSAVLALKFREKKFIESRTEKTPALLLDDVFSELDFSRQKALVKNLGSAQCFLTTTDSASLKPVLGRPLSIFNVAGGQISNYHE